MGAEMNDDVSGSGGGGKAASGGGSGAVEDANTLTSNATAEIIELLGEGEIVGLVDGARSIYLNDTPLQAADGSYNFQGVSWVQRVGLPDQEPLPNFVGAAGEVSVGVKVTMGGGAITRTITDPDADAVRVTLQVPSLSEQDTTNGNLHGSAVAYQVSIRPNGGAWTVAVNGRIEGKTTSSYQRAHRLDLSAGGAPWEVRVERVSADSAKASTNNDLWWESYSEITYGKFIYPDSALIGLRIDAKQFGSAIPSRAYEVKGRKIRVPTNYTPETRSYAGLWDGSFRVAWSDNPAWIFLDLVLEERFGLGDFVSEDQVDKWGLYQIARYCDAVGSDGAFVGVPDGRGGRMPRFTFNGVLQSKEDAYRQLQQIASCFRGLTYWSSGQLFARADMPRDPKKLVTAANVVDGLFSYSGTALKARHTVVHVSWNDPSDGYRPAIEVVEDRDGLIQYGYRVTEVAAPGATNREQAHRFGKWLLESEQRETETVTYRCAWDHLDVMPGDLIQVQDPSYAGLRMGGRLVSGGLLSCVLDAPVVFEAGKTHTICVTLADGTVHERSCDVSMHGEPQTTVMVSPAFPASPEAGAVWVITASDLHPRLFSVLTVSEQDPGVYAVTALLHDPAKYLRVDDDIILDDLPYALPPNGANGIPAPTNLRAVESVTWANGLPSSVVTVSWTAPNSPIVTGFDVQVMAPGGQWSPYTVGSATSFEIRPAIEGPYVVRVASVGGKSQRSATVETSIDVHGKGIPPGAPTALTATGGIRTISLAWVNPSDSDLSHIEVYEASSDDRAAAVKIAEVKGTAYVRPGLTGIVRRWYWVRAVDLSGNIGDFNSNIGTSAESEPANVDDIGVAVWDKFKNDIVLSIPDIDFSFLENKLDFLQRAVSRALDDSGLAETLMEALRLGYERFEEIKRERGISDTKFAVVDTQITQAVSATEAVAAQVTTLGSEFADNRAIVQQRLTTLANNTEAVATSVETLSVRMGEDIAAAVLTERTARVTAVDAAVSATTILRADFNSNTAAVGTKLTALANADSATTTRVDQMVTRIGAAEAAALTETQTRTTADSALSSRIDTLVSRVGSTEAAISNEASTRASQDSALSTQASTMLARISSAEAAIASETTTRVAQDGALTQQITQARAYSDANLSGYDVAIRNWVNNSSALASSVSTMQTTVADNTSKIQTSITSIDGIKAKYSVTIDSNGWLSGISLIGGTGAGTSAFLIRADNFGVAMPGYGDARPFTISTVNGSPRIAMNARTWIADATIDTLSVAGNAITVPQSVVWYDTRTGGGEVSGMYIYMSQPGYVQVIAVGALGFTSGAASEYAVALYVNGGNIMSISTRALDGTITLSGMAYVGAGNSYVSLQWAPQPGMQFGTRSLTALGVKR